ncbi:MAG TPA: hypothetical protein VG713_06305, partial [Pirellulales bacterium]|nr:hypothetical protein [Pirellulales bacterium]
MRPLLRMLGGHALATWANNGVSLGCALLLTPWIIQTLGATTYGVWAFLTQLTGYAGLFEVGMPQAVSKAVARARAGESREQTRAAVSTALAVHLG